MTWRETVALAKSDLARRLTLEGRAVTVVNAIRAALLPGGAAVVSYRLGNWLFSHGHPVAVRCLQDLVFIYTGSELHAGSSIGPGLVLSDGGGIGLPRFATIGKQCTILGRSSMTLGGLANVDLSRDRITIGDNCVIGSGTRVVGAVRIADGTQIKPNSVVLVSSMTPGAVLSGMPARRKGSVPLDVLARWNPWKPEPDAATALSPEASSPGEAVTGAERASADIDQPPPPSNPALHRSWRRTMALVRDDLAFRCKYEGKRLTRLTALRMLMHPGVHSVVRFRLQCFCYANGLGLLGGALKFLNLVLYRVEIDEGAEIGGGLHLAHANNIVITKGVVIGERCILFHQNSLGISAFCEPGQAQGPLVIGNDVIFGGGSCAYGNIVIGDGCQIGVNTAVDRSVPPGSVVFGVPGRLVGKTKEAATTTSA